MAQSFPAVGEDQLASVPVATWSDGTTVQSVVVPDTCGVEHEYWVVRDGHVLARLPSLADVDAWQADRVETAARSEPS
jgi:hypothetical protein